MSIVCRLLQDCTMQYYQERGEAALFARVAKFLCILEFLITVADKYQIIAILGVHVARD